jgi:hypothetical protein
MQPGPEEIVLKDGRAFVRTYDTDVVLETR